ncbi:type I-E CRISPR-associated protein Cas7/Cse4/CasC [Porticoccus sp.]
MSQFIQLHLLTMYPPSNLNRDDLGRPKTAIVGGTERLRISSQSLKRAWRESEVFNEICRGAQGKITRRIGYDAALRMVEAGVKEKDALAAGIAISSAFVNSKDLEGKDKEDPLKEAMLKQPVRVSAEELSAVNQLVDGLISGNKMPEEDELDFLRKTHKSVDIALFGRMLASKGKPDVSMEAAAQISHAFTVTSVKIEDDYFTAVEDLKEFKKGAGSAFIADAGFGSGVFYTYCCISKDLLISNLQNDEALARQALSALAQSAATVAPTGKQNSFASRAYTSYLLAEKGSQQPRSLSVAFLKATRGEDPLAAAIENLEKQRANFEQAYGACADGFKVMDVSKGEGSLEEIIQFITE